jgi:ectoine hydroxylase-related dioxygenase (phytanoyl-CoA dioxygenase family)
MQQAERDVFAQNGFLDLGQILDYEDVDYFQGMFEQDRDNYPYFWRQYGHHQHANYDALITTSKFDELIRHPKILPTVEELMGGPLCFGEIGLRSMGPYDGAFHQGWHRDKPHRFEHPLRMDYIQLMVYLSDVTEDTHCLSLSPESLDQDILENQQEQLARGGVYDLHGPAGTCALFNVSVLHTATTRPTKAIRKTVQIYYGHRDRPYLANDSGIPATLWRDNSDEETRSFYGVLNERTRTFMAAFGKRQLP